MVRYNNNIFIDDYTPFTICSLCIALLWTGIFIAAVSILRKKKFFMEHFSIYTLFVLLAACMARILLPMEMPFTVHFNCNKVLPEIRDFFNMPLLESHHLIVTLGLLIILLWILPAILIIYRHTKEYLHFKHTLNIIPASKDQNLYRILAMADIHNKMPDVKIIIHSSVKSPAITGLYRPVIILPDINFNDDELFGIFIHEISHYKSRHCFIKLVMEFICAIFWWNPLFMKLSSELSHAMELQSDKDVCLNLTHSQTKEYMEGITKIIRNTNKKNIKPPCSCSVLEEDSNEKLMQRFRMIAENRYQNKKKLDLIAIPLAIAVFLLSYLFIFQPFSEPTFEDMRDGSVADISGYETEEGEEYLIKVDNGYDLYSPSGKFIGGVDPNDLPYIGYIKIYESKEEAEKERKTK